MDVIDELIAYCEAWEPWARVMGKVCAGDAAKALRGLRADLTMAGAFHKAAVAQRNSAWEEIERLRAELATEHKRQSAMRALIASLEGQLMRYRSKQAEADEAVRTLDSERAANATLTAELAECSAVIEAARCIRHWHDAPNEGMVVSGSHVRELWKALNNYDAARKGEGE